MNTGEMDFQSSQNKMLTAAETLLRRAPHYSKKDYRSVCQSITAFENHCLDAGYPRSQIDDACFFICAFLDEQIDWGKSLLTTFYESDTNRDNEFFDRLERRQSDANKYVDLLELAYFCLSLGFRGKFHESPPDNGVVTIMHDLYNSIRDIRDDVPQALSIETPEKEERVWRCPPMRVTAIVALAILISIFLPYNRKLNQYITPALAMLHNVIQADDGGHEN